MNHLRLTFDSHFVSCQASLVFIICSLLTLLSPAYGEVGEEAKQRAIVRGEMNEVYQNFQKLYPYIVQESKFIDQRNSEEVLSLIDGLRSSFEKVGTLKSGLRKEPGFASTLQIMGALLDDVRNRFAEGQRGYAYWRMRTVANHCVTCHTRHAVSTDFVASNLAVDDLNQFEKGEFYLASRQFDKAADSFLEAFRSPGLAHRKMEALRKWLIIVTRVHPDPSNAINTLSRIRSNTNLLPYQDAQVRDWLVSLRRWQNESKAKISPVRRAENLIRQGIAMNDPLSGDSGEVELLRATSLLHGVLDETVASTTQERDKTLYLLGLAYSNLEGFFANELPELFLEQCIRDYPNSKYAKQSFRLLEKIVTLGFTGSGGTHVPDDIELHLKELHNLAYGVKRFPHQV